MNYFFVDAETDGLYGKFLSIAVIVTDSLGGEIEHFYGAVKAAQEDIKTEWVLKNVFPFLSNAEIFFDSEYTLLEAFWDFWIKYKDTCFAVADVMSPVEARLFAECVHHNTAQREFSAPYPLLDLSTLLYSKGIDCKADRQKLAGLNLSLHDALNDVKLMSKIWHSLI